MKEKEQKEQKESKSILIEADSISAYDSGKENPGHSVIKKNRIKRITGLILIFLLAYGCYRFYSFYTTPNRAIQQTYLIPKDAIFIILSDNPVSGWNQFSESEPWKCLRQSPSFADITEKATILDSVLHENRKLMSLVGKRDLMISIHKVRPNFWDFLYIVDLQKISEIELLKEQIQQVYSLLDFKVTYRKYKDIDIIELTSTKTHEILYTAFVDNHYIASYSSKLVQASIDERNNPVIGLDPVFIEANKLIAGKGLFRIYIQYAYLPEILDMYLGKDDVYLPIISKSMSYAGLKADVNNNKIELNGYTFFSDTINAYVSALFHSGKKEMQAHHILSDRTAFYTNIGFDDPVIFVKELEKALSANHPSEYLTYKSSYEKIESTLGISLADDFLSWMSGEFAFTELEPGLLGQEPEIILAIRTKDPKLAKEKMASIEKKVKKRTPVSIKAVDYKNYMISYVELKGFFALFFGKMFDKFEKPYYTYIDDYMVLSNRPASLLSFVEDYVQKRTLGKDKGFEQVLSQVDKKSTYFIYTNTQKVFPLLKPVLNKKSWEDLNQNKEIVYSFPYATLQITGNQKLITMQACMNYFPYQEELIPDAPEPEDENVSVTSEIDEIDELKRFYAEKFQGNVYREFYPEGSLKSECEIHEGRRHGKYHEYYKEGTLKIRGKYSKGQPKGTWIYYSEEGKPEHKVKM
ncbi:MAG: DUF3352 domain-containing protein [Tannerella sp.]|jgi:antitoxin component YwqK of YwqJK toxin-antitoxin module|nr:DUF3352 domain-containing protein [Tannerella sp.]